MMTMVQPYPEKLPNWWVPKLHHGYAPAAADYDEIQAWLRDNCTEPFYIYPGWTNKKGAEFEDDDEARSFSTWAKLRWS